MKFCVWPWAVMWLEERDYLDIECLIHIQNYINCLLNEILDHCISMNWAQNCRFQKSRWMDVLMEVRTRAQDLGSNYHLKNVSRTDWKPYSCCVLVVVTVWPFHESRFPIYRGSDKLANTMHARKLESREFPLISFLISLAGLILWVILCISSDIHTVKVPGMFFYNWNVI